LKIKNLKNKIMWVLEFSRQTTATKEQIWNHWADVAHWNICDSSVERSELYGDFKVGTKGVFKPVGGPKSTFVITNCKPLETFTNTTYLPLCKVDTIITLTETPNGLLVNHRVEMTGFLTFFFSRVAGKKMAKTFPQAIENLMSNIKKSNK